VHGRFEIALVGDVDGDRRVLRHLERRSGHRAVVGEHPHRRIADPLLDRDDLELVRVAVSELDQLRLVRVRQTLDPARKFGDLALVMGAWGVLCVVMGALLAHG
jgi:hypothetical protein